MNKFKMCDKVKVKTPYFHKQFHNQIGTIVDFVEDNDPYILFDNKELNYNWYRKDGAHKFYKEYVEKYTINLTKKNLLDE